MNNERSYIWTAEKHMKTWLIITVIHTTNAVVKLKFEKKLSPQLKYMSFHISIHKFFSFYGNITNSQLPVALKAPLVEHRTGIAEVMGSNPDSDFNFTTA